MRRKSTIFISFKYIKVLLTKTEGYGMAESMAANKEERTGRSPGKLCPATIWTICVSYFHPRTHMYATWTNIKSAKTANSIPFTPYNSGTSVQEHGKYLHRLFMEGWGFSQGNYFSLTFKWWYYKIRMCAS